MIRSVALVLTVFAITQTARAQQQALLDDVAVDAAIKAGQSKRFSHLISDCIATPGFGEGLGAAMAGGIQRTGGFNVYVSANAGRIAYLAADAKRLYKPFTIQNVDEALRTPMAFVAVYPQEPDRSGNTYKVAAPIERVVLKSKNDPNAIVQPETFETEPVQWKNLLGGSVDANSATATFPFEAIKRLPPGEFDVVVITPAGERRCKVGQNDRKKVFP